MEEGQRVAYNRSGDVIEGTIIGISPSHVKIKPHEDFDHSWQRYSRVRNRRSILVLP